MLRIAVLILLFVPLQLIAQRAAESEIGFTAGVSVYQGDLTEQLYTLYETNPMAGIFWRHTGRKKLGVRMGLNYARLRGSDHIAVDAARVKRNLSFFAPLVEGHALLEYNLNRYYSGAARFSHGLIRRGTPYFFTGLAFFWYKPKTRLNNEVYELQRIPTEVSKSYSLLQLAIPVGIGVKYSIAPQVTLGIEFGFRKTFTDYLDDVSGQFIDSAVAMREGGYLAYQLSDRSGETGNERFPRGSMRGNPKYKDNYYFVNITLSKTLSGRGRYACPGRRF